MFPFVVDVVKSVVVTHNTVVVVPYSAKIEYFEVPEDGAQTAAPKRARTANREFKFGVLFFPRVVFNNRLFTKATPSVNIELPDNSARGYEERGHKKRRNSIDNLLDMFPVPPSYIPPLPPLPNATRELLDEVILKDVRRRPSFYTVNRPSSSSSCESTTSSMFSGSASCDTTQTSPPSTPNSARSPFSPLESTFTEIDLHEDDNCGFPAVPDTPSSARSPFSPLEFTSAEIDGHSGLPNSAQSPFSPVEPTFAEIDGHEDDIYGFPVAPKVEILLWPAESMCEGELRTLREPAEVDPFSLSVGYALALQEHAAADEATASAASKHYASSAAGLGENGNEDLTQYICPEFFESASDYDALVKFHDRNVAASACASLANLGGKVPEEQEFDRGSEDQPVRDMLDISPSEEAIVDSLLSQLETSFELDEKEGSARESALDWYAEQGFNREVGYGFYDFSPVAAARAVPSVAPLRIVKKNKPKPLLPVVVEREEVVPVNHAQGKAVVSGPWEEDMVNALKAFREAEAEDEDFRELFYRDSSCFSESSCVVKNTLHDRQYSGASSDGFYDPERLKRLDESFESLERSMEQILADLDQMYDGDVTLKLEEAAGVPRSGAGVIKDLRQQENTKDDDSSVSEYSDVNEDSGVDGVVPRTWGFSDDGEDDDDDERETSSGGESDHWSDILELDDYSA